MAITVELLDAVKRDSGWKLQLKFTDGDVITEGAYKTNALTDKQLLAFVRSLAVKAEEIKVSDFTAHIGTTVDIATPVVVVTPPTAAEIAKAEWFTDYRQLNSVLEVTSAVPGLLSAEATTLIASLRTSLEADWLNSYLGDI